MARLSDTTAVYHKRRYRIIDVSSRDCKRMNCVREAEMGSDLCYFHLLRAKRVKNLRDYRLDRAA